MKNRNEKNEYENLENKVTLLKKIEPDDENLTLSVKVCEIKGTKRHLLDCIVGD